MMYYTKQITHIKMLEIKNFKIMFSIKIGSVSVEVFGSVSE